ncbi:MAG TPA: NAD-dependent epimerase/dehydratase family protein, partial [Steroidobacteraceae bacterium]
MEAGRDTGSHPGRPHCLIVGCGYVGTRLARRLATDHDVRAVVRSAASIDALRALQVDAQRVDLDVPDADLSVLPARATNAAVFYLAPPPEHGTSDPRLARFLGALGAALPTVLVYMSTTGVYGDTGGAVVTEDSELAPSTDRARRRVAAERLVNEWCVPRQVRCVILRVPGIYGPGRLPLDRLQRDEPVLRPEDAG